MKKKNGSLGRDALDLTVVKMITLFISLVSSMLLSRFRTLEEYGTFSQITIAITLAISLFTMGLPNSTNFFLARAETREEKKSFLSTYYIFNTVLCVIMGVALAFATPLIASYFDNDYIKSFVYVLAILPWAQVIYSSLSNVLVVYRKTRLLMLYQIANSVFLLGIIVIVKVFSLTFESYMLLFVAVQAFFAIMVYITISRLEGGFSFNFDTSLLKRVLIFAIPMGLATITGTLNIELDKIMVGSLFSTEELAIYTNASKELPLTIVAASLTSVLLPQLARFLKKKNAQRAVSLWKDATDLSYIIICFFVAALFAFAPQVITVLYSGKYLPGVSVFRIYTLVLLLRVTYFGMILNSVGKSRLIFYCALASLGLNVVLNYLFYLLFGFIGPAIATFLSIAIIAVFQLIMTCREVNLPFRAIMPWKSLLFITIINAVPAALIMLAVKIAGIGTNSSHIALCIGIGALWMAIYFFLLRHSMKSKYSAISAAGESEEQSPS